MPMGFVVEETLELLSVDEVSVVRKTNAVRAVDIERLRFGVGATSSGGISQVTQTHKAGKIGHPGAVVEDLGGHTIALALIDAATRRAGSNPTGILSAMLKEIEGFVQFERRGRRRGVRMNQRQNTAHFVWVANLKNEEPLEALLAGHTLGHPHNKKKLKYQDGSIERLSEFTFPQGVISEV